MGLFERLQNDNQRILGSGDMLPLALYNADGDMQAGYGRYTAPALGINPQGQPFVTEKFSIAFHIKDFSLICSVKESFTGWKALFLDSEGDTITGSFNGQMRDTTFGYVSTTLTGIKVVT